MLQQYKTTHIESIDKIYYDETPTLYLRLVIYG